MLHNNCWCCNILLCRLASSSAALGRILEMSEGMSQQNNQFDGASFLVNYFRDIYSDLGSKMMKGLADRDPQILNAVRTYIRYARQVFDPMRKYIKDQYADDKGANGIMNLIENSLSMLENAVDGHTVQQQAYYDYPHNMATIMGMFEEANNY